MRWQPRSRQAVLFEADTPTPPPTGERREELVRLLGALISKVITNRDRVRVRTGDEHESDHA